MRGPVLFSRRAFVVGGMAGLATFLLPKPGLAITSGEARALVDRAVGEINDVINSGKGEAAILRDFERIFQRYADVDTIARSVLGPPARSASSSEMAAFTDAFIGYVARKYGRRFREFAGSRIEVTGARPVKSYHEVQATAKLRGQSPFAVSFFVSDRSGRDLFFDLRVEGISLLKAERAEVGAIFDREGRSISRLTGALKGIG